VLLKILPPKGVEILDWNYRSAHRTRGRHRGLQGGQSGWGRACRRHLVYFVAFRPHPELGQTLADVMRAEAEFVKEIARRHPKSPKPIIVGNCQGGWAAMILAAANPDISGQYVRPSSDPVLPPELEKQIADGTLKLAGNRSIEELERERDTMLWNGDATRLWIPMFALLCGPTSKRLAAGTHRLRQVARSVRPLCRSQAHDAGNHRRHPSTISFAAGTHRGQKRLSLSEQRDAGRATEFTRIMSI